MAFLFMAFFITSTKGVSVTPTSRRLLQIITVLAGLQGLKKGMKLLLKRGKLLLWKSERPSHQV